MILSDGINSITLTGEYITEKTTIESSNAKSAGGNYKQQVAGERYENVEKIRLTGTQYKALTAIIKSNAVYYYYTPTVLPDLYDSSYFPMQVVISGWNKTDTVWNGQRYYYVELTLTQVALT